MSHISTQPLTTEEYALIQALDSLSVSGANQAIAKTGSTSFANVTVGTGGGGTPGGSNTQLQYNNNGAFGGISGATTNGTNLFVPTLIGGSAVGSSLSLQSTSGVGTTDYINFLVGNNGGTEAMRIFDSGNVAIGKTTDTTNVKFIINYTQNSTNTPTIIFRNNGTGNSSDLYIDKTTTGNPAIGFSISGTAKAVLNWNQSVNSMSFFNLAYSNLDYMLSLNSSGSLLFQDPATSTNRATFFKTGEILFPSAPQATANLGTISLGSGPFDGSTSGYFKGSSSGTSLAINEVSGYAGSLLDLQVAGVRKFQIATGGIMNSGATQTTYNGSVTGTAVWSMPFQGTSYKKFIIYYNALQDAGGTISFPTAFSQTPTIYGDAAAVAISSATTTTFTIAVASTISGFAICEGY